MSAVSCYTAMQIFSDACMLALRYLLYVSYIFSIRFIGLSEGRMRLCCGKVAKTGTVRMS